MGRAVVTGLCDVADALPRVELAAFLYPTNAVKEAVSVLYAHTIKFLVRALNWYEEGKVAHALHSITKPAALQYDDLIEDIRRSTRSIADLATSNSQAEQRDIHDEVKALSSLVKQLRTDMLQDQSLKSSILFEVRTALSEVQLTQALTMVSSECKIDYKSSFRAGIFLRDRNRPADKSTCTPFWTSSKLQTWDKDYRSSLLMIRASFGNRFYLRDFSVNVIEQLRNAHVAVLWVLRGKDQTRNSVIDALKSLVHQALSFDGAFRTDLDFAFQMRKFAAAQMEDDYTAILGSILQELKLVYIIVEAESIEPSGVSHIHKHLESLTHRLSERDTEPIVKIMALSYGPSARTFLQSNERISLTGGKRSNRKGKKIPLRPLLGTARGSA